MQSEIRSNGTTQIRLTGERPIEKLAIQTIVEASKQGQRIIVYHAPDDMETLCITLEHSV